MIYQIQNNQIVELTNNYIEYLLSRYIPDQSLVVFDGHSIDNVTIPQEIKHIVFDCSTNPVDIADRVFPDVNLPYTVISGLYKYHQHCPGNIKFLPFWAMWMSDPWSGNIKIYDHGFRSNLKKYTISCLNGTQWNHRKLVYLLLSQRSYFEDLVFTFGHRTVYGNLNIDPELTIDELELFKRLPSDVAFVDADAVQGIDVTINHPAYFESYVNLVTETTVKSVTPMLSEKTFKPIVAGQLFVLIASPGAIEFLRNIGIDTFDDIIDHSYDHIQDIRTRIEQALVQVDRLAEMDLPGIYDKIKPRLINNSEFFLSKQFRDQFWLN